MFIKRLSIFCVFIIALFCIKTKAAPIISNFAYTTNTCNTTSKAFTVNISDAASIATGSLTPRVYYRKNMGAFISTTGTLTAGTLTNGVWTFNMTYTITSGDFIYFYVVAQNIPGNITAFPSDGFSATDVNTIISDANNPIGYYYGILNGIYTVGNGGNFNRLTEAAIAYSSDCTTLLGPVTFVLTDTLYSPTTGEVFPIVFKDHFGTSPTNSLSIKPSTGQNVIIRSDTNAISVLKFANTKYFSLDGFNGVSNTLLIQHKKMGNGPFSAIYLAGKPVNATGCKNGTIKNLNISGPKATSGIFMGEDTDAFPSGAKHEEITISNNLITGSTYGINAVGSSASLSTRISSLSIISNTIGPSSITPTVNMIFSVGLYIREVSNSTLNRNLVQNCMMTGMFCSVTNTLSVIDNTITGISDSLTGYAINVSGMILGGNSSALIKNNVITNISNVTTGWPALGVENTSNPSITFQNNMISDIKVKGAVQNYTSWPIGIYNSGNGFLAFENNSVNLYGSHSSSASNKSSAALVFTGSGPTIWRNNIICNTYDYSGTTNDTCYCVYVTPFSTHTYTLCDYNDYFAGGPGSTGVIGKHNNNNLTSLSMMQSVFGGHQKSFNVAPVFILPNDLHMVVSANPAIDNTGQPLSGLLTDFDNQIRSTSYPDIGADEFLNTSPCIAVPYGNISTTSYSFCSGLNAVLKFNGIGSGSGLAFQWKVSSTPGGPYTNVVGGFGATTTTYTTPILSGGVYYYVLEKTCTSASISAISNEATVSVNPSPSPSAYITCKDTLCAGDSLIFNGGTDIATIFNWAGPSGFNSTLQNPSINLVLPNQTGIYSFTASTGTCSTTASVSILVYTPIQPTVSASPSPVCPNASCTLSAIGAVTYTWNTFSAFVPSPSVAITATANGVWYQVVVTDSNGCLNSNQVLITWKPTAAITSASSTICVGQSATLSIIGSPTTYTWVPPASGLNITVTPTATSNYSVYGTSSSGCNFFTSYPVYVDPIPSISISSSHSISCIGQAVTLTASGASSYNWSPITYTGSILTFSPLANYSFTVSGYNSSASCFTTALFTQTVTSCTDINENLISPQSAAILPNPNNGNFVFHIDKEIERGELIIYNSLGQIIYSQSIYENRNEISLNGIEVGMYYFKLKLEDTQNYNGKFVIE